MCGQILELFEFVISMIIFVRRLCVPSRPLQPYVVPSVIPDNLVMYRV